MTFVPESHPRFKSLVMRERLVEGMRMGIVDPNGLIAHGRGEALDYLLGEKTHDFADSSITAAVAQLKLSRNPVFSINGNVAALVPDEIASFANSTGIPVEINLFHRTAERIRAISEFMGAKGVDVLNNSSGTVEINGLDSHRAIVCRDGIHSADSVLVPLEDGDRTAAIKKIGKFVIVIDLNPLSRSARDADISIIDNIVRVMPLMVSKFKAIEGMSELELKAMVNCYDNRSCLDQAVSVLRRGF